MPLRILGWCGEALVHRGPDRRDHSHLINQGDALVTGMPIDVLKLLLTYLVPYCVSTYGAVSYRLHAARLAATEPEPALVR